jgi:phosphate transport system substrate-binding protein
MDPESRPVPEAPEDAFAREAAATGLVLPERRPFDVWGAVAIAVALVVIAAGIGEVTGWINLRSNPPPTGFQYLTCSGTPIEIDGAVAANLDPSVGAWLESAGGSLSQSVGGCVAVSVTNSTSSAPAGVLSDHAAKFAATYVGPGIPTGSSSPSEVAVVPAGLSAVAVVYNLPNISQPLNLSGALLAGIFSGSVRSWDSPGIAALNPGLSLSGLPPISVHYDGGSTAMNAVFTEFLSNSNSTWNTTIGTGETVAWPAGSAVGSDAAMLATVGGTVGAVGYIDLLGNAPPGVEVAQIGDAAGSFVAPDAITAWIAAESFANSSVVLHGQWSNVSLLGATATDSYPISWLTYVGFYHDLGTAYGGALSLTNATWMLEFVYWLTEGSTLAPLPTVFSTAAASELNNETYDGTPIVPSDSESGESGGETGEF